MGTSDIREPLAALVREKTGDPDARVSQPVMLPGHAGQSVPPLAQEVGQGPRAPLA
jgi:hypothetical protein